MSKETIGIRDVIHFFRDAEIDTVELAMELGAESLQTRKAAKAAVSARLSKARAAKGKGAATQAQPAATIPPAPPQSRQRHGGEPAAHAAPGPVTVEAEA